MSFKAGCVASLHTRNRSEEIISHFTSNVPTVLRKRALSIHLLPQSAYSSALLQTLGASSIPQWYSMKTSQKISLSIFLWSTSPSNMQPHVYSAFPGLLVSCAPLLPLCFLLCTDMQNHPGPSTWLWSRTSLSSFLKAYSLCFWEPWPLQWFWELLLNVRWPRVWGWSPRHST